MNKIALNKVRPHTVGFEALAIAFYKDDEASALEFETVEEFARAQSMTITPVVTEDPVNSNDSIEDEGVEVTGFTLSIKTSAIKLETRAKMYGHTIDDNGGMIEQEGDKPRKFALLAKFPKSNGGAEYVAFYKCAAKPQTEEHETKKNNGVTRFFPTTEITASKAVNGLLRYVLDSDSETFKEAVANAWFDDVYIPGKEVTPASEAEG